MGPTSHWQLCVPFADTTHVPRSLQLRGQLYFCTDRLNLLDWPLDRDVHASTFRLNPSTFCGIRWVLSLGFSDRTAQVQMRSGRVHSSTFRRDVSTFCGVVWTIGWV